MSRFFKHTVKPDDDQPIVLITAPKGSAVIQIGGSTPHSTFLLHDNFKSKSSLEKRSQMQLKLDHMMLSITDEINMAGFKEFQSMNQTMCTLKGTTDGKWGELHELTQSMRQKDMKFVNCLNKIHTTVPLEGSEEDRMLHVEHVGHEARYISVYNSINKNSVPVHQTQVTFPVDKKASFQATRTQFPLTYTNVKDSHCLKLS